MKNITLTIDGRQVTGPEGATILEIARANGIDIPTLCHDEKLEPFGSCFLCITEVEGARRLMPACATKAADGMVVQTETDAIRENRRMCLELLLSDHKGDCIGPCKMTCPNDLDPQGYIAHVADDRYEEAIKLIKSVLPLPAAIGRVCPRPCEDKCRRAVVDKPVAIDAIKRFVADWDLFSDEPWKPELAEDSGKKVAIVGAGPAGLTAAYFLRIQGHSPVIFEQKPKPGGMFRYGIPEYRLPYDVLDKEIATITRLGVEIRYGRCLGRDFTVESLKKDFDAVILATGAWKSSSMRCEGEDLEGVWGGIEYLISVVEGKDVGRGGKVVVVGGGNTAIDAARTAWRLGSDVTILYRRTRAEMPAHPDEIEAALHEEIDIQFLAAPRKIVKLDDGRLEMTCIRMELGEPDASGRRRPVPIEGSDFTIVADTIISAIGQKVDTSWNEDGRMELTRWGSILADEDTGRTSLDGVFAAGDCATGADIAIKAIAGARKCAAAVDRYLRGEEVDWTEPKVYNHSRGENDELDRADYEDVESIPRERLPEIGLEERRMNMKEVELTYSEEQVLRECSRCLECGCQDIDECDLRAYATRYGVGATRFSGDLSPGKRDYSHPFILREPEKCIKCGRCIRTCDEVQGVGAWGFADRGFAATVEPTFRRPLEQTECESCGQCVSACPTGALIERVPTEKPGPFELVSVDSTCTECGVGCAVMLSGFGRYLMKVLPRDVDEGCNAGNLCKKGRFDRVFDESCRLRLDTPMVRKNGKLVETTWEEALSRAAALLQGKVGKGRTFVSPSLSNEAFFMANLVSDAIFGQRSVACAGRLRTDSAHVEAVQALEATNFSVLREADLVILVDPESLELNRVAGNHVIGAVAAGAELVVVGEAESKFDFYAGIKISCAAAETGRVMNGMARMSSGDDVEIPGLLADEHSILAQSLSAAKRPVIIANVDIRECDELDALAGLKSALDGSSVVALRCEANGAGFLQVVGPAGTAGSDGMEAALLLGVDPFGPESDLDDVRRSIESCGSLVVLDSHYSRTVEKAEVFLPVPGLHETDGTITNSEGRVQRLRALSSPPGNKSCYEVLNELGEALGLGKMFTEIEASSIFAALAENVPAWKALSYDALT